MFFLFRKEKGTTMDLWQQVLIETKNKSKMHLGLSDNVSNNIVNRFMIISDDCQRISKKVNVTTQSMYMSANKRTTGTLKPSSH